MFKIDVNIPQNEKVVGVRTTENRGFTPDELAEQCVQKIVSVSDNTHQGIRDQARAFSKHIEKTDCILYATSYSQRPHNCV